MNKELEMEMGDNKDDDWICSFLVDHR